MQEDAKPTKMNETGELSKKKISRIYDLCSRLYGKEFSEMFMAPRETFRIWLNKKTGCDENHITDLNKALDIWLVRLEFLNRTKKI